MIVSGSKVMFLDPSKKYLTFTNRASRLFELSAIKRCVDCFCSSVDRTDRSLLAYTGTISHPFMACTASTCQMKPTFTMG